MDYFRKNDITIRIKKRRNNKFRIKLDQLLTAAVFRVPQHF